MRLIHSRQIVALEPWSDLLGCHVGVRADVIRGMPVGIPAWQAKRLLHSAGTVMLPNSWGGNACPTTLLLRHLSGVLRAVLELRLRVNKDQVDRSHRPVTLLADDQ